MEKGNTLRKESIYLGMSLIFKYITRGTQAVEELEYVEYLFCNITFLIQLKNCVWN